MSSVEQIKAIEKEITRRKQLEMSLERVTRQNKLILNAAGEGIYGLDLNGHTIFCNPAAAKMIGYEVEELIGKPQHDILHHSKPDGSPYPREECPIYAAFKDGGVHHVSNEVFWKKDGTSFPVEYVSTPVEEKGKLVGAVVIFRDITERKKAENLSIRLGRILDNSFNEIYMFDASALKFIQVSQGACMNLGYSMEELRQLTPLDLNPEFTPEQFQALINPLRQGIKEIIIFETDHKRKNGTRYPVEVRLQLAKMETPHMFIAIIQDITERKKAEEKNKEHIAELEHFTYSASHDLQEPLRKILLFGSRLSESSSSSLGREERDYISRMEKASLRMKNLIEDLLEYSQLAHLGYNFELTDLTEVVKEVIDD
ncbi:MAG: PAS domain S-box protein, partial [Nitrospinae bacterium]|nr:PAS domain S-box protein [Nitrospinota bacterium]